LIEGNNQNQALNGSSVKVKFLTLALRFFFDFICLFMFSMSLCVHNMFV